LLAFFCQIDIDEARGFGANQEYLLVFGNDRSKIVKGDQGGTIPTEPLACLDILQEADGSEKLFEVIVVDGMHDRSCEPHFVEHDEGLRLL
jgi:hypothetical protein